MFNCKRLIRNNNFSIYRGLAADSLGFDTAKFLSHFYWKLSNANTNIDLCLEGASGYILLINAIFKWSELNG